MTITIGRRRFIALLGAVPTAWPLPGHPQQAAIPVVGLLSGMRLDDHELGAVPEATVNRRVFEAMS
jgi:hypothetical protein